MRREMHYWFRAKRYGWGWGLPSAWQGWTVFGSYLSMVFLTVLFFRSHHEASDAFAVIVLLTLALIGICWWKGEPARWRWGKD